MIEVRESVTSRLPHRADPVGDVAYPLKSIWHLSSERHESSEVHLTLMDEKC